MPDTTLRTIEVRPDRITMETGVGRVVTTARFENLQDAMETHAGTRDASDVRTVEVDDALIDTGCTLVGLTKTQIDELGLQPVYKRPVRSATGLGEATVYSAVRLTIMDRTCSADVFEVPEGVPVLIGQIPLEQLDFVVDTKSHKLVGNPDHGGEWMIEMY